jgi:GNAT superfamily N-acetyltransferase
MVEFDTGLGTGRVIISTTELASGQCIISSIKIHSHSNARFSFVNDIIEKGNVGMDEDFVSGVEVWVNTEDRKRSYIEMKQRGDRLHMWHLHVHEDVRGLGLGGFLVDVFKKFANECGVSKISGRIGNHGTKKFLSDNGFPEDRMFITELETSGGEGFSSVAIGPGSAKMDVEVAKALQTFEGFPIEEMRM